MRARPDTGHLYSLTVVNAHQWDKDRIKFVLILPALCTLKFLDIAPRKCKQEMTVAGLYSDRLTQFPGAERPVET